MVSFRLLGAAALAALAAGSASAGPVKNVIVMVADGAGFNTLQATRMFTGGGFVVDGAGWTSLAQSTFPLRTTTAPIPGPTRLAQNPATAYNSASAWNTTPVAGPSVSNPPYPASFQGYEYLRATSPDSGNTMSSMMTGVKNYNNAINVDGNGTSVTSLAELSRTLGKKVGVVTTVQFSDATPASGAGTHAVSRTDRQGIANQIFQSGGVDVIAGVGNPDYDNNGMLRTTPDYSWVSATTWNALKAGTLGSAQGQNWKLFQDRASIQAIANGSLAPAGPVALIGQAFDGTQEYRVDPTFGGPDSPSRATYVPFTAPFLTNTPTLSESSNAALRLLNGDADGMFMVIEAGGVDRAMHSNNLGRMIEEYVEFNAAIQSVMDWISGAQSSATWDDTLLIVTADHDHNLYGPNGETIPFQDLINNGAGALPGHRWFGNGHGNSLIPLFAFGAGSAGVGALGTAIDTYTDAQGRTFGRGAYTDQAALGRYLLSVTAAGAVPEPGTWAMLIGGMGVVGGALRRRRPTASIALVAKN